MVVNPEVAILRMHLCLFLFLMEVCPFLHAGAYVHAGHSYYARGEKQIRAVAEEERAAVIAFVKL